MNLSSSRITRSLRFGYSRVNSVCPVNPSHHALLASYVQILVGNCNWVFRFFNMKTLLKKEHPIRDYIGYLGYGTWFLELSFSSDVTIRDDK